MTILESSIDSTISRSIFPSSVRGLRHEPGHHADVPVRAPGRLQDLLRQDDPGRRRRQEIAVEVSAESPGRSVPSLMLSYLLP